MKRFGRGLLHACLVAALWMAATAGAATVADLYEVSVPVADDRDAALREALRAVVIRVSGSREAPERLGAALDSPWNYAQRSGVTADGMLQVGFDSLSIDRLLSDAGLPVWGRERPATLVWLSVEDRDGMAYWLGARTPAAEREAIERAARQRGVPLVWPTLDQVDPRDPGQIDPLDRDRAGAQVGSDALLQSAARYGASATLLGRARRDFSGGLSVQWTLVAAGESRSAEGTLEDGVHLAADTFASLYAASGSSLEEIGVEVAGIIDLDAYAATLNYLESMTLVRAVAVEEVAGDRVRLRLAVRGDQAALRRALALEPRLAPVDSSPAAPPDASPDTSSEWPASPGATLQLRYRP